MRVVSDLRRIFLQSVLECLSAIVDVASCWHVIIIASHVVVFDRSVTYAPFTWDACFLSFISLSVKYCRGTRQECCHIPNGEESMLNYRTNKKKLGERTHTTHCPYLLMHALHTLPLSACARTPHIAVICSCAHCLPLMLLAWFLFPFFTLRVMTTLGSLVVGMANSCTHMYK